MADGSPQPGGPEAGRADLLTQLWAARDAAIGAEAAAGQLRARIKELESDLDDRHRHVEALLEQVRQLQEQNGELGKVARHRDAMLRSPTWRAGTVVMRPLNRLRGRGHAGS